MNRPVPRAPPAGGLDPRPGDGGRVRGGPGDLQRRQIFGQDLAVDAAGRGAQKPSTGQEDQGEARLIHPTIRSFGVTPEDVGGPETMPATGKGTVLDSPGGWMGMWKVALALVQVRGGGVITPLRAPSCASVSSATLPRRPSSRLGSLVVNWCHGGRTRGEHLDFLVTGRGEGEVTTLAEALRTGVEAPRRLPCSVKRCGPMWSGAFRVPDWADEI
jgi:hypothetical protein